MFLYILSILLINVLPKHTLFKKKGSFYQEIYNELDEAFLKTNEIFSREAFINATQNISSIDIDTLNNLAANDFGPALFFLGDMYLYGIDPISTNLTKAVKFYKKAAKKNITSAFPQLGFMYTYGLGVQKNIPKAVAYHKIGCQRKSSYSCIWEAYSYRYGTYKPKSLNKALTKIYPIAYFVNHLWSKNIISQHIPEILTRSLKLKTNKNRDDKGKLQIIKYKAALGDENADIELAHAYYYGHNGQEQNIHKAREIFERHLDNSDALVHLAKIHHLGEDGPVNLDLAEHYYEIAAGMDDVNAYNNLGVVRSLKNDSASALELMKKAAEKDHPSAKFNIAMREINSNENLTHGLEMMRELAETGMPIALLNYGNFERNGVAQYDEEDSFLHFHILCGAGPWREESETAEGYYKNGSYNAALLLWMQLSDQGQCQASFNAALVLENWERITKEPFLVNGYDKYNDDFNGNKLRNKLSSRMFKNAINYCVKNDLSPFLYEFYMKRNMTPKAINVIKNYGNSSESSFIKIKLMLKGKLPLKMMDIKKEFSIGIEENPRSFLAFVSLIPWIIYEFFKRGFQISQNVSIDKDDLDDFAQFVMFIWKKSISPFEMLIVFNALIILIKKRFEIMYHG